MVVLSYAQSIDGSIAGRRRERIRLSGPESMQLTYSIRALCDTILVGIGTVLSDNPRLSLKQVTGTPPRPLVLDTRLRTPLDAAIIQNPQRPPWLIHGPEAPKSRLRALAGAGAEPIACATGAEGWVNLGGLMRRLAERSIDSVMVEGGARVITSFTRSRLADWFIITISPKLLGGLPVIDAGASGGLQGVEFDSPFYQTLGRDLVVWARPGWDGP
jgi:3,4-dihydroxy 2-butanone 4-phosphate synthase/GTP cyclohydrolase II